MMYSYHIIFQFKLSCAVIILTCHILSSFAQQSTNNGIPITTTTSTTSTTKKPSTSTSIPSKVQTELTAKNIAEFRDHIRRSQRKLHLPSFDNHHQHCSCDLKDQSCDLNCCCDDFCSPEDRHVFSSCKLNRKSEQFLDTCIDENLIFRNNSHHEMMKFLDLFCIVYENRKYKKLFADQKPITNMTEYDEKILKKNLLTWSPEAKMSPKVDPKIDSKIYPPYHGQPVWATSMTRKGSELEGKFSLPISNLDENGFCDTFHDIQFLTDTEFSCIRDVESLARECNSHGLLGSSIFHENIYIQKLGEFDLHNNSVTTSRADINETALFMMDESESSTNQLSAKISITKKDQLITDSDRSFMPQPDCMAKHQCVPVSLTHDSPKLSPQLIKQPDGSIQCHGIVSSVNYIFNYHPIDGIESVSAQFEYINLTKSRAFRQRFKVTFKQSEGYLINKTAEIPFEYSGNPGYLFDKPVLFHSINKTNSSEKIVHYKLPIQKQGNGQCCRMNVMMDSVRFGRNHRGGCMLNVTTLRLSRTPSTVCQALQKEIFDILDGFNQNIDSVASFGNPNVSNSSDWIPFITLNASEAIQVNSTPNFTHDGRCPSLVTGISIEIIHSLVGDYNQPQNKIISIIKKYYQPQDVRMRCLSLICRKYHNFPLIELSYSVSFISFNSLPKTIHGSLPIIHFRLPSDFFYPFSISFGMNIHSTYTHSLTICLCWSIYILLLLYNNSNNN
ncbi:tectonic [Brevipalpus obovatus]|uniref:tectonic n=1 Tax=Brevipalpus obovatus TaxID=246614 RepID=UPI003D9F764E